METFPQHQQLQKNVLLTICSDRILQEVNFDKYRCGGCSVLRRIIPCSYIGAPSWCWTASAPGRTTA
jgi:hypothetical protein